MLRLASALGFGVLALGLSTAATRAQPATKPSLGSIVSQTVRAHYQQIHRCYRQSLAVRRDKGGTVFLDITLGSGDRVRSVEVTRDELGHAPTAACLARELGGWRFKGAAAAGAGEGSAIIVPLTFRGHAGQTLVALADVPGQRDASGALRKAWLTAANAGARWAVLEWIESRAEVLDSAWAPRLLLLVQGSARLGKRRLRPGQALWVPAGEKVRIVVDRAAALLRLECRTLTATKKLGSSALPLRVGRFSLRRKKLRRKRKLALGKGKHDVMLVVLEGTAELRRGERKRTIGRRAAVYLPAGESRQLTATSVSATVLIAELPPPEKR